MRRLLALSVPILLLEAGCRCNPEEIQPLAYEDIDSNYGKWLSMDVAPDGSPAIAYYDVTYGALGFALGEVGAEGEVRWHHERVTGYPDANFIDETDAGLYASMKIASDGDVWVAYQQAGALFVAHRAPSGWSVEQVDTCESPLVPKCGVWSSMALDAENRPVVAHQDSSKGNIRISRRIDNTWINETVYYGREYEGLTRDSINDTDTEPDRFTRPPGAGETLRFFIKNGVEYLVFYDKAFRNLQMLVGTRSGYEHSTVYEETNGEVGYWPSLWTDGTALAIAFEDRKHGRLLLAERASFTTPFTVETVDEGVFLGSDSELIMRDNGFAIVYFDGFNNDLKLATRNTGVWTKSILGGANGAMGYFNELVALNDGEFAATYDYTHQRVFFKKLPQ